MKKLCLVLVILALVCTGTVFAQQKSGFVRGTMGVGMVTLMGKNSSSDPFTNVFADIDLTNSFGLTIGFQQNCIFNDNNVLRANPFGIGYTFDGGSFNIGAKFMLMMVDLYKFGGGGIDINASFWLVENFGLSVILDYLALWGDAEGGLFSVKAGLSIKI